MSEVDPETRKRIRAKLWAYAKKYAEKSGTFLHPNSHVTETVIEGLECHVELFGRPLCPCNFYPEPENEAKHRRWICACDEMQRYKYCHCLLFVDAGGRPVTEHLPFDHEGRRMYGDVKDPNPTRGRALAYHGEAQHPER